MIHVPGKIDMAYILGGGQNGNPNEKRAKQNKNKRLWQE